MSQTSTPSLAYNIYQDSNISIIVPFFNEQRIEQNIRILENELKAYFQNYEIILVSDGSTDAPRAFLAKLEQLSPHIKLLHYPENQGKGFALKHGFEHSKGEYVAFIDGGMELHPRDIKRFLVLMDIYDADIVIGSKRHAYSNVRYPYVRKFLSICYQIFIRLFLHIRHVKDSQVGLKLFRREVLEVVLPQILVKKYAFDLEVLTVATHLGYKNILEAPIELDYYRNQQRHRPLKDLVHTLKVGWPLLLDTLAIFYRLRIKRHYDSVLLRHSGQRSERLRTRIHPENSGDQSERLRDSALSGQKVG
ncbi:MAG: glycosyltransferase family 2 protein [bacterium]|nr:glycosyltransferase family 2 protein [bacterium]